MTRRGRASVDDGAVETRDADDDEEMDGDSPSSSSSSSPSTPPPAKRTRAQTHSHPPSPPLPPPTLAKISRRPRVSAFPLPPPRSTSALPVFSASAATPLPPDAFDCLPTLSVLTEYFSHHHHTVSRAAHQQGEALQTALAQERRLQQALGYVWKEKERHKVEASAFKARAEALQSSLSRFEDERTKEAERLKLQLGKERKERKEAEEKEKTAEIKVADVEKKLKSTERRLTLAEKKAARLEDADVASKQQMQTLRDQLTAATSQLSSATHPSSASSTSSGEVAALRLKVSFYEGDQSTLHALSLMDLSALGGGLQASLDRVKEEQERRKECKLCLHELATVVFLPCEHMISCVKCSDTVVKQDCPVCRTRIERRIQTKS